MLLTDWLNLGASCNVHLDQLMLTALGGQVFCEAEMDASRALNDQFRILFEAAPNGVMVIDATGCIIQLNVQTEKMFGYSREELIGRPVEVLVPVRFRQEHVGLRKKFVADPQMRLMGKGRDLFGVCKDGSELPVEIGINSITTSGGNVIIATIVDITERKLIAEEKNAQDHERDDMELFQQLGMPAAILQHDGRVLFANPLFKKLHSQIMFKGDRIEVANSLANNVLKQELACLGRMNGTYISKSHPIPATDDNPPWVFHLLPTKGPSDSTLGILVVTTLDAVGPPSSDLVQKLFALAPAEARVATLIGSGLSPRQAAEKLGISEGTVRTTLQHVFTKIGVSRQSELAVLLTKLALR